MLAVITGGSGSGKSEYAESVATSLAKRDGLPLYYIATMRPFGAEGMWRVERHRKLRAGKGVETIECYVNLKEQTLPEKGVVLDVYKRQILRPPSATPCCIRAEDKALV